MIVLFQINKLMRAGANILSPITVCVKYPPGTVVDYAYNVFYQVNISCFFHLLCSGIDVLLNANAAATLLKQRPEKNQTLNGIRSHDLCDTGAVVSGVVCQHFDLPFLEGQKFTFLKG